MSRLTRRLRRECTQRGKDIPDRNNGREENEEAEGVDVPLPAEPVEGDEEDRESERDGAENLRALAAVSCEAPTFAILLTSISSVPILVSGSLVLRTARVSLPVKTTSPTAEPAARTVLAQSTFSTLSGMAFSSTRPGSVERRVRTP
jgi:hypothetical protein